MDYSNESLIKLGRAFLEIPSRNLWDQDGRGWNKCLNAIWKAYNDLQEDEIDKVLNEQ